MAYKCLHIFKNYFKCCNIQKNLTFIYSVYQEKTFKVISVLDKGIVLLMQITFLSPLCFPLSSVSENESFPPYLYEQQACDAYIKQNFVPQVTNGKAHGQTPVASFGSSLERYALTLIVVIGPSSSNGWKKMQRPTPKHEAEFPELSRKEG